MKTHTPKTVKKTLHDVAMVLGNPVASIGIPFILAGVIASQAVKPFKGDLSGTTLALVYIGGTALLCWILTDLYARFTGRRILRAIEKDYGPLTRAHVYKVFAEAKGGDLIDLDIPALARSYNEAN